MQRRDENRQDSFSTFSLKLNTISKHLISNEASENGATKDQ
jgi:hypothetical protein